MNAILEIAVIALVVGLAVLFVARRVTRALRGGRPSCCSDAGEAGQLTGNAACADAARLDDQGPDGTGPEGNPRPRPSYCAGCTGCGPRS